MTKRTAATKRVLALALAAAATFAACEPGDTAAPEPVPAGQTAAPSTTQAVHVLNSDRVDWGHAALPRASDLDRKAQDHAEWMARNRKLAHTNITSGVAEPYNRLGENVGVGSSIAEVQSAFMNSDPHFKHIVDWRFTSVGVGVARGSDGRIYVAQVFKG